MRESGEPNGGVDLGHVDGRHRVAQRRSAGQRPLAVERLEARGRRPGDHDREREAEAGQGHSVTPPH
jgi:hypothetical protein